MKKLYFTILFLLTAIVGRAQQKPQYTQYIFNNYLINPAITGIENYTDIKAGYRNQWTGLNGAPVTMFFTAHTPLGNKFIQGDPMSQPANGEDPMSRSYVQDYQAAPAHHGVGFTVVSDKAGPITQSNYNITYAYHLGLSSDLNLSVGVSAGLASINLNTSQITLENALDPAIANGNTNQLKPDLGLGIWAYSATYFVGVSAQQVLPQTLYFSSNSTYNQSKTVPHYFVTAGVKLFLAEDVTLLPSVMFKYVNPVPSTFDVNLKMAFQDKFWIGGSYRHNDAFAAMAGVNVGSFLNFGYAYDFTTSNLNTVSNGTHEIILGIMLNNAYKVICPRRFW
ncbi:MAG: type IX secretion system membrane protein PorP/SprF [Sphingobacteriaceae bacterium]|nr:MAG: type IX secretion system membrane protein PorP/SprF [Sphingobacteriaceae bacterium]